VIKLSDDDISWLYPAESMDEVAKRWIAGGASLVVITRGAYGIIGYTEHGFEEVESAKVSVVDTVGANANGSWPVWYKLNIPPSIAICQLSSLIVGADPPPP
jgi:hypothetical protein